MSFCGIVNVYFLSKMVLGCVLYCVMFKLFFFAICFHLAYKKIKTKYVLQKLYGNAFHFLLMMIFKKMKNEESSRIQVYA